MKLQLINLGRNKINKTVEVKNINGMWRQLQKHLMSRSVELVDADEPNLYDVYVGGFRKVGQVNINLNDD